MARVRERDAQRDAEAAELRRLEAERMASYLTGYDEANDDEFRDM